MQLHFREYGHGTPLLLLHGLFGSLENWHPLSRKLGAQFHVFALDQRNHGHSPHSAEMSYRLMADDVKQFMVAHRLGAAHLLGHSMGGKTAMQFALLHSELVGKLVVADIAPRAYPPAHDHIFEALTALDLKAFAHRREIEEALAHSIPSIEVRRFLLKNATRGHTGVYHWKINLRDILQNYSHLNGDIDAPRPFDKPVLFVRGEQSDYITAPDVSVIRERFPRAEIETLPGAGHWVHADAPEAFLRTVLDFLACESSEG